MIEIKRYTKEDDAELNLLGLFPDNTFQAHRWLKKYPFKRAMYHDCYHELLQCKGKRVLDIAGGYCSLTRELAKRHKYILVDIMFSDDHLTLRELSKERFAWHNLDWRVFTPTGHYDVIIANDIFPNLDTRLEEFIDDFLPHTDKLVMTLTTRDKPLLWKLWYKFRYVYKFPVPIQWSTDKLEQVLQKYGDVTLPRGESLHKDGRNIYLCTISKKS
jgi:hypothetical protein